MDETMYAGNISLPLAYVPASVGKMDGRSQKPAFQSPVYCPINNIAPVCASVMR